VDRRLRGPSRVDLPKRFQLVTGALEDAHHARVAHEHVGPEAANAATRAYSNMRVDERAADCAASSVVAAQAER
jgi:hypothetical protein